VSHVAMTSMILRWHPDIAIPERDLAACLTSLGRWIGFPADYAKDWQAYAHKVYCRANVGLGIVGEDVAGVVVLYANDHLNYIAHIPMIVVSPIHRGRGIGRALMYEAIRRSRSHGMQQVALEVRATNANAIALYTSLAFKVVGNLGEKLQMHLDLSA
jgi:ribosomal protein S18 acetylase RimI-like enzyme